MRPGYTENPRSAAGRVLAFLRRGREPWPTERVVRESARRLQASLWHLREWAECGGETWTVTQALPLLLDQVPGQGSETEEA